jgi:membrane-associated PAP2 superfamily phosphatase
MSGFFLKKKPPTAKPESLYPEAHSSSGFFLKKKPPLRLSSRACLLWFCSGKMLVTRYLLEIPF